MLELDDYQPSSLLGADVSDSNFRLRFFLIFFSGIIALGSVLYWRSQLLLSQEFVPSPSAIHRKLTPPAAPAVKNTEDNSLLNEQ